MADAKKPEAPVRNLIPTGIITEYGELYDDPNEVAAMGGQQIDHTYTPGWSDLKWQRDHALAEVAQGKRAKGDVPTLPGNVRLVRRSTSAGQPDMVKQIQSSNRGGRPITKEDIGQPWFKAMPPGATTLADGTITKGDCVYYYFTPEKAARIRYEKDRATTRRLTGAAERAESAGVKYESTLMQPLKGAPPSKINVQ